MFVDGSVIVDSYKVGMLEVFVLFEVIEGLWEGLLLMNIGFCYEFVIFLEFVWGKKGNGGKIGVNVVLYFDVWLMCLV